LEWWKKHLIVLAPVAVGNPLGMFHPSNIEVSEHNRIWIRSVKEIQMMG
jgi:hypothetical protein